MSTMSESRKRVRGCYLNLVHARYDLDTARIVTMERSGDGTR